MNKITFTGNKLCQYVMYFEAIYGNCVGGNKEVYEQECQRADRHTNKPEIGSLTMRRLQSNLINTTQLT